MFYDVTLKQIHCIAATDHFLGNTDDEVYIVMSGHGPDGLIPARRINPPDKDYFPMPPGSVLSNISLYGDELHSGQSVYLVFAVVDQDNAQIKAMVDFLKAAVELVAGFLMEDPDLLAQGGKDAVQGVMDLVSSLIDPHHDPIGAFAVSIKKNGDEHTVRYRALGFTTVEGTTSLAATLKATGSTGNYVLQPAVSIVDEQGRYAALFEKAAPTSAAAPAAAPASGIAAAVALTSLVPGSAAPAPVLLTVPRRSGAVEDLSGEFLAPPPPPPPGQGPSPGVKVYYGQSAKALDDTADQMEKAGYRPRQVSCYRVDGAARYASIWDHGAGAQRKLVHGTAGSDLGALIKKMGDAGYRPLVISASAVPGQLSFTLQGMSRAPGHGNYATLWEKSSGPAWSMTYGVTLKQFLDEQQQQQQRGFRPAWIHAYMVNTNVTDSDVFYACIWEQAPGAVQLTHGIGESGLQQAIQDHAAQGYRLRQVTGHQLPSGTQAIHYTVLWDKTPAGTQSLHVNLNRADLGQTLQDLHAKGYRLVQLDGCPLDYAMKG